MRDRDVHHIIRVLKKEVRRWPVPAIGHFTRTPYTTLISCVLSLRTKDQTTAAASDRLFAVADTPERMLSLAESEIEELIYPVSFFRVKSKTLLRISADLIERFGGTVPDAIEDLLTLPGVGRKTANIVITLAFRQPGIAVDTHVHRIPNRWGYVQTRNPDETEVALRRKLPRRYWLELNEVLVAFGQNLCKPVSPLCSRCPIAEVCDRRGVTRSR